MLEEKIQIDYVLCKEIIDKALQNGRKIDVSDMDRDLWLQLRQVLGIGASDSSTVMGLNRYKTAYKLWQEKVDDQIEPFSNNYTIWGNGLEQFLRDRYAQMTGLKVEPDKYLRIHPEHDCLFANLDGLVYDKDKLVGAIEIKTTDRRTFKSWKADPDENPQGIPLRYYTQIMQQFACLPELEWIDEVVGIVDERTEEVLRIKRDDEFIEKQCSVLVGWYNAYVKPVVAPPKTAFEFAYAEPILGSMVEADDDIAGLVGELKEKKAEFKALEKEIKGLENKVKEFIGETEILTFAGEILATWKEQSKESISKKGMVDYMDIFEKCKTISKFRVLRLK